MIYNLSISGMKLLLRPLICPGSAQKMFDNNMAVGSVPSALGLSRSPLISKKHLKKNNPKALVYYHTYSFEII